MSDIYDDNVLWGRFQVPLKDGSRMDIGSRGIIVFGGKRTEAYPQLIVDGDGLKARDPQGTPKTAISSSTGVLSAVKPVFSNPQFVEGLDASMLEANLSALINGANNNATQALADAANANNLADAANTLADLAIDANGTIKANAVITTSINNNAITAPKILAGAVIAGKLAANSVQAGNLQAGAVVAGDLDTTALWESLYWMQHGNQVYYEDFEAGNLTYLGYRHTFTGNWAIITTGYNSTGGFVAQATTKNAYFGPDTDHLIPITEDALYRLDVRAAYGVLNANNTAPMYWSIQCYNQNKVNIGTKYPGTMQVYGNTSGGYAYNNFTKWMRGLGAAGDADDPTNPLNFLPNTSYIRPFLILNHNQDDLEMRVDRVEILKMDPDQAYRAYEGINANGTVAANKVIASSILAGAVEAGKLSANSVTVGNIDDLAIYDILAEQSTKDLLINETWEHGTDSLNLWAYNTADITFSANNGLTGNGAVQVVGYHPIAWPTAIPYNPDLLHRLQFRVAKTVEADAGNIKVWSSFYCYDRNKNWLGARYFNSTDLNNHSIGEWVNVIRWVTGNSNSADWIGDDPTNPSSPFANTSYIYPYIYVNWNDVANINTTLIDMIRIETLDPDLFYRGYEAINANGTIAANKVIASSILAGAVSAGKLAANSVTVGNIDQAGISDIVYSTLDASGVFEECWEQGANSPWTHNTVLGSYDFNTDGEKGTYTLEQTGRGVPYYTGFIPYDPDFLYRFFARVRRTATTDSNNQLFYAIVYAYGANQVYLGSTNVGSKDLTGVALNNWYTHIGWMKGISGGGPGGNAFDPLNPRTLHNGTKYIRLGVYLNWDDQGGTNVSELDSVRLESFDEDAQYRAYSGINANGTIAANKVIAASILAGAVDATKMNVSELSAISANVGNLTAGNLTGLNLYTAGAGNDRIHAVGANIAGYAANNAEIWYIRGNGVTSFAANMVSSTRGDVITFDYNKNDLTLDGSWHALNMSGIIPAGYRQLIIRFYGYTGANNGLRDFYVRPGGANNNTINFGSVVEDTFFPNITVRQSLFVSCNNGRFIEYRGNSAWSAIGLTVGAYWQ